MSRIKFEFELGGSDVNKFKTVLVWTEGLDYLVFFCFFMDRQIKILKNKTPQRSFWKGFPGATDEDLFCSLIRNLMAFYCDPQINTS